MIAAELCLLADPAFKITTLKNVEALNDICLVANKIVKVFMLFNVAHLDWCKY